MDNELKILHQFIWQPCINMHPLWWQHLDVEIWQEKYRAGTLLSQRINALVVSRYGLVANALSMSLGGDEKALLRLRNKLKSIVIVLGLFYLNCPDYLLMRSWRDALGEILTEQQILQAWALWPQRPQYPLPAADSDVRCEPENLLMLAEITALRVLDQQYRHNIVWQAIRMVLPPVAAELLPSGQNKEVTCGRWLFRLGSLL